MKYKQLRYLAKQSLSATSKANKIMITMLAVSMIIIIPIVLLCVGVNVSISNQLNKSPYELSATAQFFDYRTVTVDQQDPILGVRPNLSGSKHISKLDQIKDKIVYERFNTFQLDTTIFVGSEEYKRVGQNMRYNILDNDKNTYNFPKSLASYGNIFLSGTDFDGNGKKQVVLAEDFVEKMGLSGDIVGKEISIFMDNGYTSGYLCKNYKVAGIVKKAVRDIYHSNYVTGSFMDADMFFCSSNVYDDKGNGVLKPYMDGVSYNLNYANKDNIDSLNEEYMMLGIGVEPQNSTCFGQTDIFLEGDSYQELVHTIGYLGSVGIPTFNSIGYDNYKKLYDISWVVTFVLGVAGAVLLVVVILDYYINIKHNVAKRKHFLTMMRAVGAKDSDIPKVYMIESNILCSKATAIFASVGLADDDIIIAYFLDSCCQRIRSG